MSKILQCKRRHTSPCIPFRFSARNAINEEARFKSVPAACSGQVQPPCAWMSWMCPARAQQDPGAMRRSTWQTAPPHDSKHGLHTAVHAQAHVVLPPWPSRSANRPIDETISSFLFYRFNKLFVSMRLMINKVNFCPLVQSSWRLKSPLNCFYCPWRNIPIFFAILQSYVRLCAFNCSIYSFNFIVFLLKKKKNKQEKTVVGTTPTRLARFGFVELLRWFTASTFLGAQPCFHTLQHGGTRDRSCPALRSDVIRRPPTEAPHL